MKELQDKVLIDIKYDYSQEERDAAFEKLKIQAKKYDKNHPGSIQRSILFAASHYYLFLYSCIHSFIHACIQLLSSRQVLCRWMALSRSSWSLTSSGK